MVRVAPEGRRLLVGVACAALVMGGLATLTGHLWLGVPGAAALGFATWFFRDPDRQTPEDPRLVVSPADGRVVDVREVREGDLLGTPATRVSIFMSPLNVHVNRSPVTGVIERIRHTRGRFHAAFADKASDENERTAMVIVAGPRRYLVVQIAGAVARRIVCRRREGDDVARGERYGMIMFGSRVDVYLPSDVRVLVQPRMRVRAGTSVIGEVPS